jgi:XTP/dITP diphosphohydrolase
MNRWVLASSNPGKLKEFQHALAPVLKTRGLTLVNQSELGIPSAEEPHETFEENALAKARHASAASGSPAFADDSGICVAALNGAPGVRSARYWPDSLSLLLSADFETKLAGHIKNPSASLESARGSRAQLLERVAAAKPVLETLTTDKANLRWLLSEIQNAKYEQFPSAEPPESFWDCAFHAAIAFVRSAADPAPVIVTGVWNARIIAEPRGEGGFGYDPIFFDRELKMTAAEMSVAQKQAVSHRGQALRKLLQLIL